jgi:hypothetical protein
MMAIKEKQNFYPEYRDERHSGCVTTD